MKRILSIIILLAISSTLTFGQRTSQKPLKFTGINQNTSQDMGKYFEKNVNQTRATIWSSTMSTAAGWTYANDPAATLATHWTWLSDTSQAATYFKQYVHSGSYMQSPTANQGVWYFDAITNLVNATYGYENSTLTSNSISTLGHNAVMLKFYQLYKSFNDDTTMIEISTDSIAWTKMLANPTITYGHANTYAYGFKQFNITQIAGNKANVWIRFRFIAPATTASGAQYSGGYGWMVDDVSLEDAPNNFIEFTELPNPGFAALTTPLWSGYTQIPSGQLYPICMTASFTNNGGLAQTNVSLKIKDISNGMIGNSLTTLATMPVAELDTLEVDNVDTVGSVIGNHNYTLYLQSDSIAPTYYKDTLTVNVNDHLHGLYSRDNDYYNGYRRYNGITGASVNSFQMANLVEITTADPIYAKSISFVIGSGTTVNAPVKAILYRGFGQTKTVIAESDYHFILANEEATTVGATPPAIELLFTDYSNTLLQKDSAYFVTVQGFGGTDTVWLAVGSSKNIQPDYSQYVYDTDNTWYYYPRGTAPAMIRLNTSPTNVGGINEKALNASLYQNMPNPAANSTRISYELKSMDNVVVEIYDFMGQKVKSFNEGHKTAGFYSIDVNLSGFASGTYFYTLRTDKNVATKKMIVVK